MLEEFDLPRVTPHALRHGFGTIMLSTGKLTLSELSKEEKEIYNAKNREDDVVDFVVNSLSELDS